MKKLNELVIKYQQSKSSEILAQIFDLLEETIIKKSKYIFYKQRFFADENLKLCDTKKIELEDVKQELRLEIIEWINRCKQTLPFDKYLYSNLWNWRPIRLIRDILKNFNNISIYQKNEKGEEINLIDNVSAPEQEIREPINLKQLFNGLTEKERILLETIIKFPDKNFSQIAKILGVTKQAVDDMKKNIRKKKK